MVSSSSRHSVFIWPAALTLVWAVAWILICSGPFNLALFGGPIILGLSTLSAVPALALAVGLAIERCWRPLLSVLVLPLAVIIVWLNRDAAWQSAILAGGYVHVIVMRPFYLSRISKLPADERHDPVLFDWGGLTSVIFDASDKIASLHHSEAWKERAALPCDVTQTSSAGGHFYVVRLGC
jgi:hypothetical protein